MADPKSTAELVAQTVAQLKTREKDINVSMALARTAVNVVLKKIPIAANWDERWPHSSEWVGNQLVRPHYAKADAEEAAGVPKFNTDRWLKPAEAEALGASEKYYNDADRCV